MKSYTKPTNPLQIAKNQDLIKVIEEKDKLLKEKNANIQKR